LNIINLSQTKFGSSPYNQYLNGKIPKICSGMTIKVKSLSNTLIICTLANLNLNKWRKDFIVEVFSLFISIKGRINFLQLARYDDYGEQRYRQQLEESFDFLA
jgi:hypothetical protein